MFLVILKISASSVLRIFLFIYKIGCIFFPFTNLQVSLVDIIFPHSGDVAGALGIILQFNNKSSSLIKVCMINLLYVSQP